MVLIGNATLDSALIQNDPHDMEFGRPERWMPAVPAYLGLSSSTQPGIRSYLIRLLGVVAQDLAATGLPRISRDDREADLDKILEAFVPYRLAMSTWKDGVHFLKGEIDYFWEQAINGPDVRDFKRLKASKRYVEVMYQDLGAWMVNMEGLLVPAVDRGGARERAQRSSRPNPRFQTGDWRYLPAAHWSNYYQGFRNSEEACSGEQVAGS
jgi:hypothetical protein